MKKADTHNDIRLKIYDRSAKELYLATQLYQSARCKEISTIFPLFAVNVK